MKRERFVLVALVLVALGGGLWSWQRAEPLAAPGVAPPEVQASTAAGTGPSPPASAPNTGSSEPEPKSTRAAQRQRADAVRARMREALAGRVRHTTPEPVAGRSSHPAAGTTAALSAAAAPAELAQRMPGLEGEGNQAERPLGKYIHETLQRQFIPLAGSCYEGLLGRQPKARGKLVLDLEIVGDDSVGGVVNDVTLGKDSTFTDEEFSTCVSESLYSTVFDAPPQGEKSVTVSYPLELEP